jgi:hypothetical protein
VSGSNLRSTCRGGPPCTQLRCAAPCSADQPLGGPINTTRPETSAEYHSESCEIMIKDAETGIEEIERSFALRNESDVAAFLGEHPFLLPLLLESHDRINEQFPNARPVLEVVTDPEGADDFQLALFIRTRLAPEEAVANLERFDDTWWLDALDRARGKLCITLEF